jgi:hypothetical protein
MFFAEWTPYRFFAAKFYRLSISDTDKIIQYINKNYSKAQEFLIKNKKNFKRKRNVCSE